MIRIHQRLVEVRHDFSGFILLFQYFYINMKQQISVKKEIMAVLQKAVLAVAADVASERYSSEVS